MSPLSRYINMNALVLTARRRCRDWEICPSSHIPGSVPRLITIFPTYLSPNRLARKSTIRQARVTGRKCAYINASDNVGCVVYRTFPHSFSALRGHVSRDKVCIESSSLSKKLNVCSTALVERTSIPIVLDIICLWILYVYGYYIFLRTDEMGDGNW